MRKMTKAMTVLAIAGGTVLGVAGHQQLSLAADAKHDPAALKAAAAKQLPQNFALQNGVSSLEETYQDWRAVCQKGGGNGAQCAIVQQQVDEKSHQRVLTVQLTPEKDKTYGTIVMPFGLALAKGVAVIANGKEVTTAPFSTCVPAGCLVPVSLTPVQFNGLTAATKIEIRATAPTSQTINFNVSPKGLKEASTRIIGLRKT